MQRCYGTRVCHRFTPVSRTARMELIAIPSLEPLSIKTILVHIVRDVC